MALLSTLVERIADVEGIDKVHASGIARYLREAGYISQAGRGRGAAHMTTRDAAHLLIGLNVSNTAKDSPEELKHYCSLTNRWDFISNFYDVCKLGNNLVDDLEKIIVLCQNTEIVKNLSSPIAIDNNYAIDISVSFHWPARYAMIFIRETIYEDSVPDDDDLARALYGSALGGSREQREPDRKEVVSITQKTFRAVADVIRI